MNATALAAYARSPQFIYVYDTGVSAIMAMVFIAGARPIADLVGWPEAADVITMMGVFLLSWALFNYALGTARLPARSAVVANITGDAIWALGSVLLLATQASMFNGLGQALVAVQALFVATVLLTKLRGWPALIGTAKASSPLGKVTIF